MASMFLLLRKRVWMQMALQGICVFTFQGQMKVESLTGPVTKAETDSFLTFVEHAEVGADNQRNYWSYGPGGQTVRALGLVYKIRPDVRLLNQMIRFCDAELSERNDLAPAPTGQHMIWTGRIDPVWPNSFDKEPLTTGGEQGDPAGNLASCANLILRTKGIWKTKIPGDDAHHYGATYLARAKTYVRQADVTIERHILKSLVDLSNSGHQYFAAASPYKGGTPVPWNQQMMFNYAFQNMASNHQLLKDNPEWAARYHKIVADSLDWFFTEGQQTKTDGAGRPAYDWGYAMPDKGGEDSTHAGMDVAGFDSAFEIGDYGLTREQMAPFANMLVDVMMLGPQRLAGRVDGSSGTGHAAETKELRTGYLLLAEFRPEAYVAIMSNLLSAGQTTTSVELFSRFLWAKNQRYEESRRPDSKKSEALRRSPR